MDKQKLFDSFIEVMSKFAQIRAVVALRDGFIMTTPFTICGSVFLLIANLPIPGYGEFMASIFGNDWTAPFNAVAGGTFNVLALIVVVAITYKFVGNEGCDASMASILALSTLLILMPPSLVTENGQLVGDIIPKAWVGSNGVITAIIIAFFVSYVFCYCEKNNVGIKMPDSVPQGVARAFTALVPGMIFFTVASVLYGLCHYLGAITLPELIFKIIQTPLQGLSDTLAGGSIIVALQGILFWAGVHGPNVVGGVVSPLLIAKRKSALAAVLSSVGYWHIFSMSSSASGTTPPFSITQYPRDSPNPQPLIPPHIKASKIFLPVSFHAPKIPRATLSFTLSVETPQYENSQS